jgi:hypothetical protein
MSDATAGTPGAGDPAGTAGRMAAIAAGLQAAGLDARVHDTLDVLDVTDEDHYVEIRYWSQADATPGQVVAVIGHALAAITRSS